MTGIQRIVHAFPYKIQKRILRLLYHRNGKFLEDFLVLDRKRFYVYKIGGKYVPSESLGWFVDYEYYKGLVERISGFNYKPSNGDVIIDIGAGMGEEVLVYSDLVGQKGKVICIEANPKVFSVLQRIIQLNKLENVQAFNLAISSSDAPLKLSVDETSFLGGTVSKNFGTETYDVTGTRLSSFFQNLSLNQIDFLKVNIEGAERFVIDSIGPNINCIRNVAIACHDFRFQNEREPFFQTKSLVSDFLRANGFKITSQNSGVPYIDDWVYGNRL